jgi:hypothetical protein
VRGDLVNRMADAIARYEAGSGKNPLSERLHNPGMLRSWGNVPTDRGFAHFPDEAAGRQALEKQIEINISRGLNLEEFFRGKPGVYPGYAPETDHNDPAEYARAIARSLGIDLKTPLSQIPAAAAPAKPASPCASLQDLLRELPGRQQPIWMQPPPPAKDSVLAMAHQPMPENIFTRDWSPVAASMQWIPAPPAPQSVTNSPTFQVDVGGIHITHPGADMHEIQQSVSAGIREALERQILYDLTQTA